jgi:HSP20 family molecular chaperone IbpA
MREPTVALMLDHVRAIHRAVTGSDPPDRATPPPADAGVMPSASAVAGRFAELESLVRTLPDVAERVPQFSFSPACDVLATEHELLIELAVPGVEARDLHAELAVDLLIVSGVRPPDGGAEPRVMLHAELPCGPFRREVRLPRPAAGVPRVEVDRGVIRVRVAKRPKASLPQA